MHTLTGTIRGAKSGREDEEADTTPPPRGMVRSDKRMLGGVAAGLARHFNIDPLIPRIGFVLLAIFAGAGALLYGLAWLALPSEDGPSRLESAFGGEPRRGAVAVIGLLLLAIGGALLVGGLPGLAGPELSVAAYLIGLGLGALWWRRGASRASGRSTPRATTPTPAPTTAAKPPPAAALGTTTSTADATVAGDRGGRSVHWAILGALALVSGVAALVAALAGGIGAQSVLAVAVMVVGVGVIAAAYLGRVVGLATVGVVLALGLTAVTLVDVPLGGGFGQAEWAPAGAADLEREYRLTAGEATLDLRGLDLDAGPHEVEASVAFGSLRVLVPPDAEILAEGSVTAGDLRVLGESDEGLRNDVSVGTAAEEPDIALTAEVGFGELRVE
ncbi:MAG: PspC domain-containing protein [Miltoncostaeaceae bacterium]